MINNNRMIKDMVIKSYSDGPHFYTLVFNQTKFGDLAYIFKYKELQNGIIRRSCIKSKYFSDSVSNTKLLDDNISRAKEWFNEILKVYQEGTI